MQEKNYSKLQTAEERIKIGCAMFDSYRSKIISSFPKDLSDCEIRQRLFLRLYGSDLNEDFKKKVLKKMRERYSSITDKEIP